MRLLSRWVVWRYQQRGKKKPTKVPFQARRPKVNATSTDPNTWATFAAAAGAYLEPANGLDGVGFVFAEEGPYVGVDFDDCLDPAGSVLPWAKPYLDPLVGYAEVSPSGRGVKVFLRGEVPEGKGRKKGGLGPGGLGAVEAYARGRFFTVTSRRLDDAHSAIGEGGAALASLHAGLFPPTTRAKKAAKPPVLRKTDREMIAEIEKSRQGRKFADLFYHGKTDNYGFDDSRADLALCSMLAWWYRGDVDAIDRMFRQSALYREKWERISYREPTLDVACTQSSFYDPKDWDERLERPRITPPGQPIDPADLAAGSEGEGGQRPEMADAGADEGDEDPHRLARGFLRSRYYHPQGCRLRHWNAQWHAWDGYAWAVLPDVEISSEITSNIKEEFDRIAIARGRSARPVTTSLVSNVSNAVRELTLLSIRACANQPAWIGPFEPGEDLPAVRDILPASNVLVDLSAARGDRAGTLPLTPRLFSPTTLGYPYDVAAPEPRRWLAFLDQLWPDDPDSIATLQDWFGYLLTPDTSQQKILMLIGPPRCGKGTINRVLQAVIGLGNVASPKLSSLANQFGLQSLIGKTLAVFADARLSGRVDGQQIVENLLSVSGEDAQTIDRKHLPFWTGHLPTRFVILSNLLPHLGDEGGALSARLIILKLTRTFLGEEDIGLTDRLLTERTGILLWAIEGWARVRERGCFVQPGSGDDLKKDMEILTSPTKLFVEEMCDVAPGTSVIFGQLYKAYERWCEDNGHNPKTSPILSRDLKGQLPQLVSKSVRIPGGKKPLHLLGLTLKNETTAF